MIYAIVAVLVLIADQAVKLWTTQNIILGAAGDECVTLIPGFIHATNLHNYGAAFGIFQDARWPLAIVSALFAVAIIVLINKEIIHTSFGRWTAVLIVAGALGNCIDRVLYGYVVDMFEFEFALFGKAFSFPVFNVADIFITISGILFCIHLIFYNEPEAVKAANEPEFLRRRHAEGRSVRSAAPTGAHAAQEGAHAAPSAFDPAPEPIPEPAPVRAAAPVRTESAGGTHARKTAEKPAEPAPAERLEPDYPPDLWSFGDDFLSSGTEEKAKPAPRVSSDHLSYEPELPAQRGRTSVGSKAAAPKKEDADEEFSLEDILSEFRDI